MQLVKYSYNLNIASFSEANLGSCSNCHVSNSSTTTAAVILKVFAQLLSSPQLSNEGCPPEDWKYRPEHMPTVHPFNLQLVLRPAFLAY
jgi:hypothetical protein